MTTETDLPRLLALIGRARVQRDHLSAARDRLPRLSPAWRRAGARLAVAERRLSALSAAARKARRGPEPATFRDDGPHVLAVAGRILLAGPGSPLVYADAPAGLHRVRMEPRPRRTALDRAGARIIPVGTDGC
jgi:hypothetical protein